MNIVFVVALLGGLIALAVTKVPDRGAKAFLVVGLPVIGLIVAVAFFVSAGTESDEAADGNRRE